MSITQAERSANTPSAWELSLRTWEALDLPEGWQAEIIEGGLFFVAPPSREHARIVALLQKQLYREILRDGSGLSEADVHQTLDVRVPLRSSLFIPDLVVLPYSVLEYDPDAMVSDALLAVEVTSKGTAEKDRKAKLWGYAHAGVPLYLLVDRWDPETGRGETTLFSAPENGRYTSATKVPFGKDIDLPEPFGITLDTSGFPG